MFEIRTDRLLTLGLFRPLAIVGLARGAVRIPVLMYHSISETAEGNLSPYYRTSTSPRVFAEHLELLKKSGYRAMGLQQARDLMQKPEEQTDDLVVITFDDGYEDFYSKAYPVLKKNNFSATMFLPTAFISNERRRFKARNCLTWDEVRECHRGGMEFGSHTINHLKLYELRLPEIRRELEGSKAEIEAQLGGRVSTFAYPYAFPSADSAFVKTFSETLQKTGYDCNVTTQIGRITAGDDPFTLRRLPANSADDRALFLAKIHGAYDWMTWPQDGLKKIKKLAKFGQNRKSGAVSEPAPFISK